MASVKGNANACVHTCRKAERVTVATRLSRQEGCWSLLRVAIARHLSPLSYANEANRVLVATGVRIQRWDLAPKSGVLGGDPL